MTVMLSAGQGSDGRVQLTCIVVSVGVRVKSLGALGTVNMKIYLLHICVYRLGIHASNNYFLMCVMVLITYYYIDTTYSIL